MKGKDSLKWKRDFKKGDQKTKENTMYQSKIVFVIKLKRNI